MIYFLVGENTFEAERELKRLSATFEGAVEKPAAEALQVRDLPDLFMGQTLFDASKVVILRRLSENKALWDALPEWLERITDGVTVVFVETKPDKRSRTYKALMKQAEVKEFPLWTSKDRVKAIEWTLVEAKRQDVKLTQKTATALVAKTGVDQWRIFRALEKLALVDDVTVESIHETVEAHSEENVFQLLETALRGDQQSLKQMLETLKLTTDPYQTFGLLSSQIMQLTVLAFTDKQSGEVARDIGAAPFVLSRLHSHAKRLGVSRAKELLALAARTDMQMKSTSTEPWVLVETMLLKITQP